MEIKEITPQELHKNINAYKLIDVRGADEYTGELGHIKGAELITMGEDLDNWMETADKNKPIVFICRSGGRSGKTTLQAMMNDFAEVYNMSGGMIQWNEDGLEVVKA